MPVVAVFLLCMSCTSPRVFTPIASLAPDTVDYQKHVAAGATYITYRQNETHIDPNYDVNYRKLDQIDKTIRSIQSNSTARITDIHLSAYASPEGTAAYNKRLSTQRANALKQYLQDTYGIAPDLITATGEGENWDDLVYFVTNDNSKILAPYKDLVLDIIRYISIENGREKHLMMLKKGSIYRYLFNQYFWRLRKSTYKILWEYDSISIRRGMVPYITTVHPRSDFRRHWVLRNNLLYDVALLPNLAAEYRFARHWSADVQGYWSWWKTEYPYYWRHRVQVVGVGLRYWSKGNTLYNKGFFAGLYGMAGTYDIRLFPNSLSFTGNMSDWSYSYGLTLGYRWMWNHRWGIETSVNAGYFGGDYSVYNRTPCVDCNLWKADKKRKYYGPTGVALSLIYIINPD